MAITAQLRGDLGRFTDSPMVELEGGPRSVAEALEELVSRYPPLEGVVFDDSGRLRSGMLLVVDGRSLAWPEEGETRIRDGGELLLMRFLAGG